MIPGNPKTLGLSPLARGTLTSRLAYLLLVGITPAHAGTTTLGLATHACAQDHPRSRGDHHDEPPLHIPLQGSPPLARGPRTAAACQAHPERITPAHAGTTQRVRYGTHGFEDHPRSRGDHACTARPCPPLPGSPPLTRGPHDPDALRDRALGITPAHAGTTGVQQGRPRKNRDHPRSRGDHRLIGLVGFWVAGSPPLTRGPQTRVKTNTGAFRITPAHAGTTIFAYMKN